MSRRPLTRRIVAVLLADLWERGVLQSPAWPQHHPAADPNIRAVWEGLVDEILAGTQRRSDRRHTQARRTQPMEATSQ
jgi:hypothetical protein